MRVADGMFGLFPYSPTAVMAVRELFKPTAVSAGSERRFSTADESLVPAAFSTAEHRRRAGGKQQPPSSHSQHSQRLSSLSLSVFSRLLSRFDAASAPVAFLASRTFFPFQVCCSSMCGAIIALQTEIILQRTFIFVKNRACGSSISQTLCHFCLKHVSSTTCLFPHPIVHLL
jgi:hypothetical protein